MSRKRKENPAQLTLEAYVDFERRRFLRNSTRGLITLAGATTLGRGLGLSSRAFAADTRPRRHLINLIGYGGWDGVWWHNSVRMNDYRSRSGAGGDVILSSLMTFAKGESSLGGRPYLLSDFGIDADLMVLGRGYENRELLAGKAFKKIFGSTGSRARFATDLLVWKGLLQQGQQ